MGLSEYTQAITSGDPPRRKACGYQWQIKTNPRILESSDPIKGVTLVELLIALTIFSVVMAVVYSLYTNQVKHSTREYKLAEYEMEFGIAKNILERDIMLAGYGIADNYGSLPYDPLPISASDASSQTTFDSISLRGTAVGIFSRTSQGWSYIKDNGPPVTFQTWSDSRENIAAGRQGYLYASCNKRDY